MHLKSVIVLHSDGSHTRIPVEADRLHVWPGRQGRVGTAIMGRNRANDRSTIPNRRGSPTAVGIVDVGYLERVQGCDHGRLEQDSSGGGEDSPGQLHLLCC